MRCLGFQTPSHKEFGRLGLASVLDYKGFDSPKIVAQLHDQNKALVLRSPRTV